MTPTCLPQRGFTILELVVVSSLVAGIGLVLMAQSSRSRERAKQLNCVNNLKQVGLAFRLFANGHHDQYPFQLEKQSNPPADFPHAVETSRYFQRISNELGSPLTLVCPSDWRRPAADFATLRNRNLSYFAGIHAGESQASDLVSGDRNLVFDPPSTGNPVDLKRHRIVGFTAELHNGKGNVVLGDGSVQGVATSGMRTSEGRPDRGWISIPR